MARKKNEPKQKPKGKQMPAKITELDWQDMLAWGRFFAAHLTEIPGILSGLAAVNAAPLWVPKWVAFQPLGTTLAGIMEESPLNKPIIMQGITKAAADAELAGIRAQAEAAGINWSDFWSKLPELVSLIKSIWDLLNT